MKCPKCNTDMILTRCYENKHKIREYYDVFACKNGACDMLLEDISQERNKVALI